MPNCDFYAVDDDFDEILRFVFDELDCRVFETYSRPVRELREFLSFDEFAESRRLGDSSVSSQWPQLSLWSVKASTEVRITRVELDASAKVGTHRFRLDGWGLITLQLGGVAATGLRPSHTNHNSQKRALKWADTYPEMGDPRSWDWSLVTRTSSKLNRKIRSLAVTKRDSRVVLPAASKRLEAGTPLLN